MLTQGVFQLGLGIATCLKFVNRLSFKRKFINYFCCWKIECFRENHNVNVEKVLTAAFKYLDGPWTGICSGERFSSNRNQMFDDKSSVNSVELWKSIWSLLKDDSCQFFDFFGLCYVLAVVGCSSKSVEITLWQLNISDAQKRGLLLIINKSTMLWSQRYC